jgi:tRNA (guanine37-N1)-methyltransferase
MHFNILTLFPEMFPGALAHSLPGKALEKGLWSYDAINIRDFAQDKHKTVDDTPYGGGAGMLMRADVIGNALDYVIDKEKKFTVDRFPLSENNKYQATVNGKLTTKIIYPSPRGVPLTQPKIEEYASLQSLTILCGRYEGVDQRVLEKYEIEEVSLGDYVLTGGELAVFIIIDACIRHINGVLGNPQTHSEESFASGKFRNLLEYPHYTRPEEWQNLSVPQVLKNGNHAQIDKWRLEQAEQLTKERRPDLWEKYLKVNAKNINKND